LQLQQTKKKYKRLRNIYLYATIIIYLYPQEMKDKWSTIQNESKIDRRVDEDE